MIPHNRFSGIHRPDTSGPLKLEKVMRSYCLWRSDSMRHEHWNITPGPRAACEKDIRNELSQRQSRARLYLLRCHDAKNLDLAIGFCELIILALALILCVCFTR